MNKHKPYGPYERFIKRPQDFLCALLALVVLSPVMLVIAVLVRVKLGSPVIFTQNRPGKDGKIFKLYKFRSMTDQRDNDGNLLQDKIRLTTFGKKLRTTSLDELPELVNILKGDMSMIGPRPLMVQYLPRYNQHQSRRHEVRPGFTGLAQVHGRNSISWAEKFDWDVKYVDHITFFGDWKIIFNTIRVVFSQKGISSDSAVTMEEFMGNETMNNDEKKENTIMTNLEKYNEAFMTALEITEDILPGLQYQDIKSWDSIGHMQLIAELEDAFDIMMDTDDIIDFNSYEKGKKILSKEKYGVKF